MDPRNLSFVANATGGELRNGSPREIVTGLCTDSRKISQGDLFVALVGDRFDAHEFLSADLGRRGGAFLVETERVGNRLSGVPQILVQDSRIALGRLGARYRQSFDVPVIGVTGSNGKTSTKRFLRAVLGERFNVCASPASFNNDIGVPLSLLRLDDGMDVAVFEIGTNHPGEIEPLARMVAPQIGVLTSIGRSHLEFFGSVEAVAHEKGFLGEVLSPSGVFVVNGDSPHLDKILSRVSARVVKVGFGPENDWVIEDLGMGKEGMEFAIHGGGFDGTTSLHLPVLGRHHLINVGLAMAVGSELGLAREELVAGVAQCRPERMRFEWGVFGGVTLFDDSYNANTDSVTAALKTLKTFPTEGERYAVLGEMGELGEFSASAHEEIGRIAAECKIDHIVAVGSWAESVCKTAREHGAISTIAASDVEAANVYLDGRLQEGDSLLVKASRSAGLDVLADQIRTRLSGLGTVSRASNFSNS